jgi:hypothetical protein
MVDANRMVADDDHLDPFCWDGTGTYAPVAEAPQPRRPRAGAIAAGLALVAAAAAAAVLLAGGGGGGTHPQSAVLDAADVTARIPGFKFALTETAAVAGQNVNVAIDGALNTQPPNGSMSLTIGPESVTELLVAPYAYVQLGTATGWDRIDLGSALSRPLANGAPATPDPQEMLAFLRSVGSVTTVGSETVGGVVTTHYHALVDVASLANAVPAEAGSAVAKGLAALKQAIVPGSVPLEVWIDAQDRVRQVTITLPLRFASQTAQIALTMRLYDYGPQPVVSAPPASQVTDLSGVGG